MARTVTVKLGNNEWHMPASYRASKEIAGVVDDPLKMALACETGTIEMTTKMVVDIIHIGCKSAGCNLSHDQVGEAIYENGGPAAYIEKVGEYIGALVSGGPDRPVSGTAKKKRQRGSKS